MTARSNDRQEKAPMERGNFSADRNQHLEKHSAIQDADKVFSTMQARFALLGHCLYKASGANGATGFLVTRWGMVRELPDLASVASFFALIGGKV